MTNLSKWLVNVLMMTTMVLFLAACGGGSGGGSSYTPPAAPAAPADTDDDGVADDDDSCADTPAGEEVDSEGCSATQADGDGDGVVDASDNCPADANADQADSDANGSGDACDAMPLVYSAKGYIEEGTDDGVSYTGQTARQVLQLRLVAAMEALTERSGETATIESELKFFINGDGADTTNHGFTVKNGAVDGSDVIPGPTYGDISTGKNLDGKIAGGNGEGGGETGKLINDEFFGWSTGLDDTPLPIELANYFIEKIAAEAGDGIEPTIATVDDAAVPIGTPQIDSNGLHYRQLLQKFLSVAVNFSQGTNDYMMADFANMLGEEKPGKGYSAGAHDFDEAFGYYGAARNINDFTDDEAAGKGGRDEFGNGYNDANGDGLIDIRSEYVFGHAQNCAKRDRKKDANDEPYYDFSKTAMDAFLVGRRILENAEQAGELSAAASDALQAQIQIASLTWEKCIAATVVHYINDVRGDMDSFSDGKFADLSNFTNLAKHWGEMKGFALGLQFSPKSPFRDGSVDGIDLDSLKSVLSLMGDAPVLADGSQGGVAPTGTAQEAIDAYAADLLSARDTLEKAYGFNAEVTAVW